MRKNKILGNKLNGFISALILGTLLILCFVPIIMMIFTSLKSSDQVLGAFWELPNPIEWGNYKRALFDLIPFAINSITISIVTIFGVSILSSVSGYVFARMRFPGKNILFFLIIGLLMVPGVLTLAPNFILIQALGLRNSWLALWAFYITGGQIMGTFLCRTFIQGLPEELFEAARIDGASELTCIFRITIPLIIPVLVTLGIMNFLYCYNDILWPMLVIDNEKLNTLMIALQRYAPTVAGTGVSRPDLGIITAGYAFSTLPMLAVFSFGMKYYVQGVTSGAVKS